METPPTPISTPRALELKDKFAFTPSSIKSTPSGQHSSRIPIPTSLSSRPLPTFKKLAPVSTPLQRLGARATQGQMPATPPITPSPITTVRAIDRVPFPEVASERLLAAQKTPLPEIDDEETKVHVDLVDKTSKPDLALQIVGDVGSEDLIIRDSEEEDEDVSPVAEKLDLGRFAFVR